MTAAYTPSGNPQNLARGIASQVRAEFILVQQAFAKYPTYELSPNYATDTGAANAYVVTLSPVPAGYTAGMAISFKSTNANTTASTLNVNALGAKTIKRADGSDLVANDILASQVVRVIYDGTNFQYDQNALASATAAAASAAAASSSASTASTQASNAATSATNALASETSASQWAIKITGVVASSEYSSKAYAIGGTGVTGAAGAAKEWATVVTGAVDGSTGFSAKAWAIGGTNVTVTSGRGAAKEWATTTGAAVDTSEFSAKEYAQGTFIRGASGGSAKDWATLITAAVDGATGYAAKAWAIGGTGVTTALGAAKEWAVTTGAAVVAGAYSAKEWAVGTFTRGAASGGSAKDWATYTGGTVDDTDYSAKYYAAVAASPLPVAAAGGTVDAITATYSPAITLADKQACRVVSAGANTSTTPTFAPNGLTAHTIKMQGGVALTAGAIGPAGFVAILQYNLAGTYWELMNPVSAGLPVGKAVALTSFIRW